MKNRLYRLLGAVLSICMVFSTFCCLPAIAEEAADEAIVKDYYVQSPGYDAIKANGYADASKGSGTYNDPAHTVADLIAIINDDTEMTANDTANVYIMQRSDWNVYDGSVIGCDSTDSSNKIYYTPYHSMTSWAHALDRSTTSTVENHTWKMVVKAEPTLANASDGKIYLAFADTLGSNISLIAAGPTTFENVELVSTRKDYMYIKANGKDVEFSAETTHGGLGNADYTTNITSNVTWDGTVKTKTSNRFEAVGSDIAITDTDGVTLTFNQAYKSGDYFNVTAYRSKGSVDFDGDFNLILNNENIQINKCIWGTGNANYTHTFSAININAKKADILTNTTGKGTIAVTNGAQVIVSDDTTFTTDLTDLSTVTIPTNEAGVKKYWRLVNTGASDAISFITDENNKAVVGKYNIKSGYSATATDGSGNTYDSMDGVLDLSQVPGVYTVTFEKKVINKDYYVRSMGWEALDAGSYNASKGSGDATYEVGTKENPAPSVAAVIDIIKEDGLVAGDTANVYIMNHSDVADTGNRYDGSVIGCDSSSGSKVYYIPYHSLTSWQHVEKNVAIVGDAPSTYDFNLVIKADPEVTEEVYLVHADTIGNGRIKLSGPTFFENVTLVSPFEYYCNVYANGNDVTYGADTKFGSIGVKYINDYSKNQTWNGNVSSQSAAGTYLLSDTKDLTFDGMNVNIDAYYRSSVGRVLNMANAVNATFTGDYNLTFNNATSNITLNWGTTKTNTTLALTNLNIHVKQGQLTNTIGKDDATSVMTANAIQVIAEKDTAVTDLETVLSAKSLTNYWYIKNNCESGIIDFAREEDGTAIAGTFSVADGTSVVAINDSTGESVWSADGKITLTDKPGTYTITTKEAETHDYDEYINYRNGIGNTYSKLTTDKTLNVVYFGGSVTAGSGSSNNELYSWRARVGNWLTTSFPTANVSNIKQSIGETGTYLGCYRVARDVVSKAPDLLFIEYSINDYYDRATYDRAQMQFETIVREVKTAYPNCDIVTILVTDYGCISSARANELHTQAKAHDDICEAYDIPSIYVGGALAEALGTTWTKQSSWSNDSVWKQYVKDVVHPLDSGYEIYFNVIKEFLNNELNYTEYDGTIKTNEMPAIQNKNKRLFDGNITYIDESTVSFTTEGGTTYNPDAIGVVSKEDYQGLIYVPAGSSDTVTVNFNGTELVMLTTAGNAAQVEITGEDGASVKVNNTFKVSIDGGEWITGYYDGKNPTVIAEGLKSGAHTAVIRPATYTQTRISCFYSRDDSKVTHEHNYGYVYNNDATCTENGTETGICSVCGDEDKREAADTMLSHEYDDCEDTDCNLCDNDRVAPGHSYTNYVANNDATCTEDGTKTAVCDNGCGKKDTIADVGSKLGHKFTNYVSNEDATCTEDGTKTAECDNGCGEEDTIADVGSKLGHKFTEYVSNNDATCQKNATETASCDNGCGETDTRDIENTIVDHKFTDEADATCDYGCGYVRPRGPQLVEEDGVTYYYYNGVKSTETGLVEYNGKTIYINKGRFLGATGLVTIDGKKLYIRNGYFLGATGIVTLDGKKFYIRNGYFLGATGIVTIDGKKLYIRNGYFLGATGLVTIDGKKLYIRKGYFLGATGIVTLDGKKLYIRNGYFLGASGTVTVDGKKYTVVNGIVQ